MKESYLGLGISKKPCNCCHYKTVLLPHLDMEFRYYFRFDDRQELEHRWILKNLVKLGKTKQEYRKTKFITLSESEADDYYDISVGLEYEERINYKKGKKYIKEVLQEGVLV